MAEDGSLCCVTCQNILKYTAYIKGMIPSDPYTKMDTVKDGIF